MFFSLSVNSENVLAHFFLSMFLPIRSQVEDSISLMYRSLINFLRQKKVQPVIQGWKYFYNNMKIYLRNASAVIKLFGN